MLEPLGKEGAGQGLDLTTVQSWGDQSEGVPAISGTCVGHSSGLEHLTDHAVG